MATGGLGRRVPTDDQHVRRHRVSMALLAPETFVVNKMLALPDLRTYWSRLRRVWVVMGDDHPEPESLCR
jgi:hypothetical protein